MNNHIKKAMLPPLFLASPPFGNDHSSGDTPKSIPTAMNRVPPNLHTTPSSRKRSAKIYAAHSAVSSKGKVEICSATRVQVQVAVGKLVLAPASPRPSPRPSPTHSSH
ncbi:hypothetical protein GYMLUDRAFT_43399 [Collybiopsis luxurians FD-317 M1]|uniref:Uncharacterized protein n=1 Tax=Collybiopsis luxurians FD-317 M1 TaxID=944289 RepID=A0A0D0CE51_9AGAR|nr:hypothetical protein GYMLUDRAFT_43399 [Collybiopsis luxurians FD-317 M1]